MRSLKVAERRLAGSFFFSRKHTKRCTIGYFFATLAYQLATNFPSIRDDVNRAIRENPALLDPDKSLHDQMEALFLQPLQQLCFRLRDSPPPVFVIDALDECTSDTEIADLISLLGQALREPNVPVIHILLTSRSEAHIHDAIHEEGVRPLVCEIPVNTGVGKVISLDGVDVDNDICIFLEQSFRKLRSRCSNFPQPTRDELVRLASRAGRRFIVASTMLKFIDDGYNDPRDRLQLMLELTSELLPGTEVYKLYDSILSTCANPTRAYLHLSVVAALADPLPMSQISELLGPGEGRDVEAALVQLRSVMDIPTDSGLPVNIYHSSIRDYVSNPSNCKLPQVQYPTSPHSLLARSSLRLMMQGIPANTTLLDALSELKQQSQVMEPHEPQSLKHSLSFLVHVPEPLQVLTCLLWFRGDRGPDLWCWLGDLDGHAWLQTQAGEHWLKTWRGEEWLESPLGRRWLYSPWGRDWVKGTQGGDDWFRKWTERGSGNPLWAPSPVKIRPSTELLQLPGVGELVQLTPSARHWLRSRDGKRWLLTSAGRAWGLLGGETQQGKYSTETEGIPIQLCTRCEIRSWYRHPPKPLQTPSMMDLQKLNPNARDWVRSWDGRRWLLSPEGQGWLQYPRLRGWLQTDSEGAWIKTTSEGDRLHTTGEGDRLPTQCREDWLQSRSGQDWLQSQSGQGWLQSQSVRQRLLTQITREYPLLAQFVRQSLDIERAQEWLETENGEQWLQTPGGRDWLQTPSGREWVRTHTGLKWLLTQSGQVWLLTRNGMYWLLTTTGEQWLLTESGGCWLQTESGEQWLQAPSGRQWLQTESARQWLQTLSGVAWLQTEGVGQWLQTESGGDWLQTKSGQDWLKTERGQGWLQTESGKNWLQTPHGQDWQLTSSASAWVIMEDFSRTLKAIGEYTISPELPFLPTFQVIQHFKSLPDFLMLPAFLALRNRGEDPTCALPVQNRVLPDMDVIHAMTAFTIFAAEAGERSRSVSEALKYACQNCTLHLSRAPKPWDDILHHTFRSFWNSHLLSWLERQWCLKGLWSCLVILSELQKLAEVRI
jgi:hypothetical protein